MFFLHAVFQIKTHCMTRIYYECILLYKTPIRYYCIYTVTEITKLVQLYPICDFDFKWSSVILPYTVEGRSVVLFCLIL
jgi:hypothetical protein